MHFFSSGLSFSQKLQSIIYCFLVMGVGLTIFKYTPMMLWGGNIQFDASFHVTATIFVFYVLWFFVDQNTRWRVPFFIIASTVTAVIAIERVISGAHNDVGIIMAFVISAIAIILSRPSYFLKKLSF